MMPVIRINDATFADLKAISAWFGTKTPTETIDRVVKDMMEQLGMERDDAQEEVVTITGSEAMEFKTAPGLSFTKPLVASVNGKQVRSPRWSGILSTTISQLKAKGLTGEKLARELGIPTRVGQYEEEGFKHLPDLDISIQGQSATEAWKEIERIANKHQIPVKVEFWWRQNEKAQHPGRTGILRAGGA